MMDELGYDYMCPNCVTPWKCNGPHLLPGEDPVLCHCGDRVQYGFDDDATHHRGMCVHCDAVRCDAYPGECGR